MLNHWCAENQQDLHCILSHYQYASHISQCVVHWNGWNPKNTWKFHVNLISKAQVSWSSVSYIYEKMNQYKQEPCFNVNDVITSISGPWFSIKCHINGQNGAQIWPKSTIKI